MRRMVLLTSLTMHTIMIIGCRHVDGSVAQDERKVLLRGFIADISPINYVSAGELFRTTFENIYRLGTVDDWQEMCAHRSPIIRIMGLLCLKYSAPEKARAIKDRIIDEMGDAIIEDARRGDLAVETDLSFLVSEIIREDDFCRTLSLATRIDAEKRGERIEEAIALATNDITVTIH